MPIYRGDGGSGDASTDAYASQVAQNAQTATIKANEAAASATAAASSASAAAASEAGVAADASAATTAAANAATSETNAASSATAASISETNAASSASSASASDTSASVSASQAATSAISASSSASSALSSSSAASSSASSAATSATNAATSATSASTAQTAAETAQTAAEAAQAAAEAVQDSIDGLYLGAQASDPTVDLNGDPVTAGDWYFNTTDNSARIYDGSAWQRINPDLIGDTTPQLGGDLDANGHDIDMGTNVITDAKVGQWDTAYGWGNHASAGYLTSFTETNDLTAAVTWANVPDANITQSSVTQHQAALSITESQISDLGSYLTGNQTITLSGAVTGSGTTSITTTLSSIDGGTY